MILLLVGCDVGARYHTCDPIVVAEVAAKWRAGAEHSRMIDPLYADALTDLAARLEGAIPVATDPSSPLLQELELAYLDAGVKHHDVWFSKDRSTRLSYFPRDVFLRSECRWAEQW